MWNLYIMYYEIAFKIFFLYCKLPSNHKNKQKKKTHTQTKPSNISHPTCCGITDFKYPYSLYTFYLTKSFKLQKKEKKKKFHPHFIWICCSFFELDNYSWNPWETAKYSWTCKKYYFVHSILLLFQCDSWVSNPHPTFSLTRK